MLGHASGMRPYVLQKKLPALRGEEALEWKEEVMRRCHCRGGASVGPQISRHVSSGSKADAIGPSLQWWRLEIRSTRCTTEGSEAQLGFRLFFMKTAEAG